MSCCVFFANRIVRAASSVVTACKSRGKCGMLWHAMTLHTPHFTLHTPHFTLHTLHSTLHALDFTLHTLHSTLHTFHSKHHTLHSTLYTLRATLHTLHFTLYTLHSTLYTPHFTLYTLHSSVYTSHFPPNTLRFTLHTPHSTFPTQHSTFFTPHTLHSTLFHVPQSTVHWYGNRGTMYKTVQIVAQKCFTWLHSVSWCILFFQLATCLCFGTRFGQPMTNHDKPMLDVYSVVVVVKCFWANQFDPNFFYISNWMFTSSTAQGGGGSFRIGNL